MFEHEIGIRLNDNERKDVEEYCISEGSVKVPAGKTVDRKGHPILCFVLRPWLCAIGPEPVIENPQGGHRYDRHTGLSRRVCLEIRASSR